MAVLDRITQESEAIAKTLTEDEQQQLLAALETFAKEEPVEDESSLVYQLTGRHFSRAERLQLEIESLLTYFNHRRALLEDSLTASQVAELLGTSRQTPHDRLRGKTLLGVLERGAYRFPIWQFDPEGPDGVIDGFVELLRALKVSDFAKLNWLVSPNSVLDGMMPIAALKAGLKARVIEEAQGIGHDFPSSSLQTNSNNPISYRALIESELDLISDDSLVFVHKLIKRWGEKIRNG